MVQESRILTAIDVGTTKVCAVIGKRSQEKGENKGRDAALAAMEMIGVLKEINNLKN